VTASDHHSEYLARVLDDLTPDGRRRVGELLDQLTEAAGADDWLVGFAADRKAEAGLAPAAGTAVRRPPTRQELDGLTAGFVAIRDQEPLDDVSDWANAVIALLRDDTASDG
jgi:hypothetical protein